MAKGRRGKGADVLNATPLLTLQGMLSNELVKELDRLTDEKDALRRALLNCILLLQDSEELEARNFCTMILTQFEPLAGAFDDHKHPFFRDVEVLRAQTVEGNVTLLLPLERVAKALNLPAPDDES